MVLIWVPQEISKMKAILEFNLDDPDDQRAHMRCVKATDMALFLWELRCNMRKKILHEGDMRGEKDSKDYESGVLLAWEIIDELFEEHDINVDSLII